MVDDVLAVLVGVVTILGSTAVIWWSWWVSREKDNPESTEPWYPQKEDQGSEE